MTDPKNSLKTVETHQLIEVQIAYDLMITFRLAMVSFGLEDF